MSLGKHIVRWRELGVRHKVIKIIYSTSLSLYDEMRRTVKAAFVSYLEKGTAR